MRRLLVGMVMLCAQLACGDGALPPLPLAITITPSKTTAAAGESVTFVVNAQGGNLFGIEIDYGDSVTEQLNTAGARTARHTFQHAFGTAGTYEVEAMVTDGSAGTMAAAVVVTVQ
jgi:plastocyanin